jgi:hypothetical protein
MFSTIAKLKYSIDFNDRATGNRMCPKDAELLVVHDDDGGSC